VSQQGRVGWGTWKGAYVVAVKERHVSKRWVLARRAALVWQRVFRRQAGGESTQNG